MLQDRHRGHHHVQLQHPAGRAAPLPAAAARPRYRRLPHRPAAWPPLEACLHAWYAVAESLADSEEEEANPLLSMFLAKLPVIPFHNNTRVISTALDCIGGFSDWLAMHPSSSPTSLR